MYASDTTKPVFGVRSRLRLCRVPYTIIPVPSALGCPAHTWGMHLSVHLHGLELRLKSQYPSSNIELALLRQTLKKEQQYAQLARVVLEEANRSELRLKSLCIRIDDDLTTSRL